LGEIKKLGEINLAKIGGNKFKKKTVHAIWYLKIPEICKR
jgi:hypothetical protein